MNLKNMSINDNLIQLGKDKLMKTIIDKNKFISHSFDMGLKPTELHGIDTSKKEAVIGPDASGTGSYQTIDAAWWLNFAAPHYHISKDLNDYIMVPVPSVITEMPNTNGDAVTKNELLQFNPDTGLVAYKSFKAKPCFLEHANSDITQAKGVILDTYLRVLKGFGNDKHYKMIKLLAFDRTKDPELCDRILSGAVNTYSMGLYFDSFSCSICNNQVGKTYGRPCEHTKLKQPTYLHNSGRLAYRLMHGVVGFETSCVSDPAFSCAVSDYVMNPREQFKTML